MIAPDSPKPEWLRIKAEGFISDTGVFQDIKERSLCTVCVEAHCPNQLTCFNNGTATFMLLGPNCTRHCTFCAVEKKTAAAVDPEEPHRIALAVSQLELKFCVLTMVTRDDLGDGGAAQIVKTVEAVRDLTPEIQIELLISDLGGNRDALNSILNVHPHVLNHNIETVPRLYPAVRPQAVYDRSLALLSHAADHEPSVVVKSGIMVGLGEKKEEVHQVMDDLRQSGCRILTIGQYLAPSPQHHPVVRYVPPDEFEEYETEARRRGFEATAVAPLVRSSYRADELFSKVHSKNRGKTEAYGP